MLDLLRIGVKTVPKQAKLPLSSRPHTTQTLLNFPIFNSIVDQDIGSAVLCGARGDVLRFKFSKSSSWKENITFLLRQNASNLQRTNVRQGVVSNAWCFRPPKQTCSRMLLGAASRPYQELVPGQGRNTYASMPGLSLLLVSCIPIEPFFPFLSVSP